ncbi:MAG TPA: ChbG/HpnK family deacetylase [Solirubrobacterales bacterium]|nr:ChbG/HpnK family deacetylase [Solirubrobacterales bacterium]
MLIVNADDWGLRAGVTDAIAACWRAGAVTSASAMVAMADSERAFGLAAELGLPLGLHLNLTTPFDAAAVAPELRARQARAVAYFAGSPRRRLLYDPRARGLLDACVGDQLDLFAAAAGMAAAHADGHQHVQTCPTVLATPALGRVSSLRRAHGFVAGGSPAAHGYRRIVNFGLRRRFRSALFVSLRDLHPDLGGVGLERLAELARDRKVEVMVHPAWDDEREVLLSPAWKRLMEELPTGSHAALLALPAAGSRSSRTR